MSFLDVGYGDRFEGDYKTVFRNRDELIYTANPDDVLSVIEDEEWYDEAALQVRVWEHNIEKLLDSDLPLTFNDYNSDMMFYEVADERIDGKMVAPAVRMEDYKWVEPYDNRTTFEEIGSGEEEQIRWMQEELSELIQSGEIAVKERELRQNDYMGPGCLRQWGRTEDGKVFLLEFGEFHNHLEGPLSGEEFLEENCIERKNHGIRSPIMLGDVPGFGRDRNQGST